MPQIKAPDDILISALNLVEEFGSAHLAVKANATDIPSSTLQSRAILAKNRGLKPTFKKEAPRLYTRERLGKMHLVIPDVQAKAGVCTDQMTWVGNYIVEKQPDVVVMIGDFFDMESLSSYDRAKLSFEGRRYTKDIISGRAAMEKLLKPIDEYNRTARVKYTPRKVFCLGNHEIRIVRMADNHPELEGKLELADMGLKEYGWEVHDFLKVVKIDGVEYSHFFTSGVKGLPVSSAAVLLRERQCSATMGHVQHFDMAVHKKTQQIAMFSSTCYLHDESYLGHQGNSQRRQIVVKHEVANGIYDPMLVSLNFLKKAYS